MSDNNIGNNIGNTISAIFDVLFDRKEENKEPTPQERAKGLIESYKLDPLMETTVVTKLADLEQQAEDAKLDAKKVVDDAAEAVKAEEEKAQKAKGVKDAAKAVALRARTLGLEVKNAKEVAEKAKLEAEVKVKELKEITEKTKKEGDALIAGITDFRFSLDTAAEMTDEEFNQLFGSPEKETPKPATKVEGV